MVGVGGTAYNIYLLIFKDFDLYSCMPQYDANHVFVYIRKSPKIAFRPDIISPTKQSPPVDDKSEPGTQVDQSQPGLHISELHSQHGSEVVQSERKPFIIDQSDDSLVDMDDDDEVTLNIGDRTKLLAGIYIIFILLIS